MDFEKPPTPEKEAMLNKVEGVREELLKLGLELEKMGYGGIYDDVEEIRGKLHDVHGVIERSLPK